MWGEADNACRLLKLEPRASQPASERGMSRSLPIERQPPCAQLPHMSLRAVNDRPDESLLEKSEWLSKGALRIPAPRPRALFEANATDKGVRPQGKGEWGS